MRRGRADKEGYELPPRFYKRPYAVKKPEREQEPKNCDSQKANLLRYAFKVFKDNGVAFATWALVCVTIISNAVILREQNRAATDTLRPYFPILGANWVYGADHKISVAITGTNIGKMPAQDIKWHGTVERFISSGITLVTPEGQPIPLPPYEDRPAMVQGDVDKLDWNGPYTIASGEAMPFPPMESVEINASDYKAGAITPYFWVFVANVHYSDIHGGRYETDICYYSTGDDHKPMALCPGYPKMR